MSSDTLHGTPTNSPNESGADSSLLARSNLRLAPEGMVFSGQLNGATLKVGMYQGSCQGLGPKIWRGQVRLAREGGLSVTSSVRGTMSECLESLAQWMTGYGFDGPKLTSEIAACLS